MLYHITAGATINIIAFLLRLYLIYLKLYLTSMIVVVCFIIGPLMQCQLLMLTVLLHHWFSRDAIPALDVHKLAQLGLAINHVVMISRHLMILRAWLYYLWSKPKPIRLDVVWSFAATDERIRSPLKWLQDRPTYEIANNISKLRQTDQTNTGFSFRSDPVIRRCLDLWGVWCTIGIACRNVRRICGIAGKYRYWIGWRI